MPYIPAYFVFSNFSVNWRTLLVSSTVGELQLIEPSVEEGKAFTFPPASHIISLPKLPVLIIVSKFRATYVLPTAPSRLRYRRLSVPRLRPVLVHQEGSHDVQLLQAEQVS